MIELIMGPMWSGKTDALIRRITDFSNRQVLAFQPMRNTRDDCIHSRAGLSYPAEKIRTEDLHRLLDYTHDDSVIVLDEAMFFGEEIVEVAREFATAPSIMIISGLDLTSEMDPFGFLLDIEEFAQRVTYIRARCQECGMPAHLTQSTIPKDAAVRVGNAGYEPRCGDCWYLNDAIPDVNLE